MPSCASRICGEQCRARGSQRKGETAWTSLGVPLQNPFMDERSPLMANHPETREYPSRYLDSDEPTGDYSDILSESTIV